MVAAFGERVAIAGKYKYIEVVVGHFNARGYRERSAMQAFKAR
jgi:hypothetical protein